jgi:hypothetical protein
MRDMSPQATSSATPSLSSADKVEGNKNLPHLPNEHGSDTVERNLLALPPSLPEDRKDIDLYSGDREVIFVGV